jgi:hypothetical protein
MRGGVHPACNGAAGFIEVSDLPGEVIEQLLRLLRIGFQIYRVDLFAHNPRGHRVNIRPDDVAPDRYQLTTIGQPSQVWVESKIADNSFSIRSDKPNVEVSWQVTGIRQDAWANAHRIPVEEPKAKADQGRYLHPELFGHEGEAGIAESHHPRPVPRQP